MRFRDSEQGTMTNPIAQCVIESYNSLPRKGKPADSEWTVLAGIVMRRQGRLETVALGTGTKCISSELMSFKGEALNDSHAEVLARRGLMRYIMMELQQASKGEQSIYSLPDSGSGLAILDSEVTFHMYISEIPCGEAGIRVYEAIHGAPAELDRPRSDPSLALTREISFDTKFRPIHVKSPTKDSSHSPSEHPLLKRRFSDTHLKHEETCGRQVQLEEPVPSKHLTSVPVQEQSRASLVEPSRHKRPKLNRSQAGLPGGAHHRVGQLCFKPGRNGSSVSMSCSDKICRWAALGLQGEDE